MEKIGKSLSFWFFNFSNPGKRLKSLKTTENISNSSISSSYQINQPEKAMKIMLKINEIKNDRSQSNINKSCNLVGHREVHECVDF